MSERSERHSPGNDQPQIARELLREVGLGKLSVLDFQAYESPQVLPREAFLDKWKRYTGSDSTRSIEGVYGAMRLPEVPPRAYAFVDVDEILRGASQGVRDYFEKPQAGPVAVEELVDIHESASGLVRPYQPDRDEHLPVSAPRVKKVLEQDPTLAGLPKEQKDKIAQTVRRTLFHTILANNQAPPVDQIEEIATIMHHWREQGIYVTAVTASKSGTESGTLAFLQQYVPDCLDALIFCDKGQNPQKLDKGDAALALLEAIPHRQEPVTAVLIDDVSANAQEFRKKVQRLPYSRVTTILPNYNTHLETQSGALISGDSRLAFGDADAFLRQSIEASHQFDLQRCPEWLSLMHPAMLTSPEASAVGSDSSIPLKRGRQVFLS
ncbi:MAG: hypothetical protein AAB553_05925 [Patescibacteria group bacterium]